VVPKKFRKVLGCVEVSIKPFNIKVHEMINFSYENTLLLKKVRIKILGLKKQLNAANQLHSVAF
jgi:hypothetical protein